MKQPMSDAIAAYYLRREADGLSAGTRRNVRTVLDKFLAVNGNISTWAIDESHVDRYFLAVGESRSRSLRVDYSVLRHFFAWLRRTKRTKIDNDPMYGRKAGKIQERQRQRVPRHDFGRLLDAASVEGPQVRILVAIGLYLLLRSSEVRPMRIADLDLRNGLIGATIRKTKQWDNMPISAELDVELRRWLTHYQEQCGELQPDWYLVPAKWGHRARRSPVTGLLERGDFGVLRPTCRIGYFEAHIQRTLVRCGYDIRNQETGESLREGEHTLRRSGGRALYEELKSRGVVDAKEIVQAMLHHASPQMTMHYIDVEVHRQSRDDLIRGKVMYSPVQSENVIPIHGGVGWRAASAGSNEASPGV